jgi:hypothetical protein
MGSEQFYPEERPVRGVTVDLQGYANWWAWVPGA